MRRVMRAAACYSTAFWAFLGVASHERAAWLHLVRVRLSSAWAASSSHACIIGGGPSASDASAIEPLAIAGHAVRYSVYTARLLPNPRRTRLQPWLPAALHSSQLRRPSVAPAPGAPRLAQHAVAQPQGGACALAPGAPTRVADARGRRTTGPPAHPVRSRRPPCARSAARASMAGVARPCAARALRCVSASLAGRGSRIGCHTGGDCSSRSFSRARHSELAGCKALTMRPAGCARRPQRCTGLVLRAQRAPARRASVVKVRGCAAPRTKAAGLSRRRRRRAWRSCRLRPWARRLPRLPQPASSSPWWCVSALP
jgi:hypothetical protein